MHSTERMLKDFGDKVPQGDKATVEAALAELNGYRRRRQRRDQAEDRRPAQASMKLGEALYQANQGTAAGGGGGASEEAGGKDNVVDVDFEEVKDNDSKKSA